MLASITCTFHIGSHADCFQTVRIHGDGSSIPNANGGTSPTFDMLTIGLGGRHAYDSRKHAADEKPSIAVILLGTP
ncbi:MULTISPECIES: hypothetical protein [Sphingobium]|jgi:hypothetical protein|uniref:Uncharacterized protein n=3 Tax=Sphingobium TaxID=165695 RepID=A0A6P1GE22_SPHYA|nr:MULTISPECIES: hypothetical protein [Sphingobium]EQB16809.1 hypothetical protein RLDS_06740 [Sphingobium lactosutens DS20]QDC36650.1 hypothetical protein FIL70_04725 [Sphingobium fuliginis ATCC 27551]QHD66745.1 hypothetical protein GS397_06545 [Sphingobium yanoikuyae]QNG43867.1 hypothetical protein H3V42_18300 [Sphingobium yanoikuyae]